MNYYQAGQVEWVPQNALPQNPLFGFSVVAGSPAGGLMMLQAKLQHKIIVNAPAMWTNGIFVGSRSWGYFHAAGGKNPRQPPTKLPKQDVLNDGGTGWTSSKNCNIVP